MKAKKSNGVKRKSMRVDDTQLSPSPPSGRIRSEKDQGEGISTTSASSSYGRRVVFSAVSHGGKKRHVIILAALVLVTLIVGTAAYFAITSKVKVPLGSSTVGKGTLFSDPTVTTDTTTRTTGGARDEQQQQQQQQQKQKHHGGANDRGADGEQILEYAKRPSEWYLKAKLKEKGITLKDKAYNESERAFRILFNSDIYTYTHSVNRAFYTLYEVLKDVPGVDTYLWGPGFPNYDDSKDLAQNVAYIWGTAGYFDFVFNNTLRLEPTRRWLGRGTGLSPVAVLYQDCFHKERLPSPMYKQIFPCTHQGSDLYFHTYANNMGYYAYAGHGNLVWHLPHFVQSGLYKRDVPHSARPVDILIVGSMWSVYPLRVRFLRLFDENRLPGLVRRLVVRKDWLLNMSDGTPTEQFIAAHKHNAENYAQALQSAKIVLVCSSKRNIAVKSYIEAAAAGALVIGDIPGEREEEFRSWVVEVSPKQSDETILHTIKWWLSHTLEREARAKKGQELVLNKYTHYNAAYEVVDAMQSYITGYRGLVFPHRFEYMDHFLPRTLPCARSLKQIEKAAQK